VVNAIPTVDWEAAETLAGRLDDDPMLMEGAPLRGLVTAHKDLSDTAGMRTTYGSPVFADHVPDADAPLVAHLRRCGLVSVGKTNTPEFASMTVTDNAVFGVTLNPWDPELHAGGSSGGAAAAVAAGYTPVAHGTDGGGSNRIPASWCGVFGMKPSRGRLASGDLDGTHPVFKTHLALSRSVRDNAAVFLATQNTVRGPLGNPYPHIDTIPGLQGRLRIALTLEGPFGDVPDPAIQAAVEDTARLCEALGHEVVPVDHPVDGEEFYAMYSGIFLSRTVGMIKMLEEASGLPIEESGLLTRCTIDFVRSGDLHPEGTAATAEAARVALGAHMAGFFANHDVWLTPVTPGMPMAPASWASSDPFDQDRSQLSMGSLPIANAIGGPGMSVPLWWDDATGLPVGSHFSAGPGRDELLYALAFQLEEARPWAGRWAPTSAKYL